MRIFNVLYVDIFGNRIGGGQRSLMDLMRSLNHLRYNPILVCPQKGKFVDLVRGSHIAVEIVPMGTFKTVNFTSWLPTFYRLAKLVKKYGIDLIHANGLRAAIYCGVVAKCFKIPFIWHVRVVESGGVAERIAYSFADKVIVNSKVVGKKFANWKDELKKVEVVYNGVDLEEFKSSEVENRLSSEFGLDGDAPIIGIVAELSPNKGHRYFLEAASRIAKELPEVKFLVVGEDSNGDAYKEELKRLVNELEISSSVYFLGFRDDMVNVLSSLTLLVHCPEQEGFGRVVTEAMALKKPVVATNAGGIPEIIKDGINGLLVPIGDTEALAKAMLDLLMDETRSKILAEAGRKTVEESFDLKMQTKKIEGIYQELLFK